MLSNVPPVETKGNTVSRQTDPIAGEIVNTLGVGFVETVMLADVAQGVAPVD